MTAHYARISPTAKLAALLRAETDILTAVKSPTCVMPKKFRNSSGTYPVLALDKSGRISESMVDECEKWATNCRHRWPC
jgi:hypothetical protein